MDATLYAADLATGSTHAPVDNARAAMILRGSGNDPRVLRMILDKRAAHLDWLTVTQRRWQVHSRRLSHARTAYVVPVSHAIEWRPDPSKLATREQYVRCHDGEAYR